ncbi:MULTISPECIES: hypothetical protein [unclassified Sphingopyxis]|nr:MULTISPECIES: hypothetical protein [unclassified Sphingopyxis]
MSVEAQIEELRAELKASTNKREIRQIERELALLIARHAALQR